MPEFIKVPVNFENITFRDFRLYLKFLDCKAQTTEGVFKIQCTPRYYYRVASDLVDRGWARQCAPTEDGKFALKAYQFVWRDLGISKVNSTHGPAFRFFKIYTDGLSLDRVNYMRELEKIVRDRLARRREAQIRWSLRKAGSETTKANFSAKSAALLFGYRSSSSGSKLRKMYFSVIEQDSKPYFNRANGRYEEPTKQIRL